MKCISNVTRALLAVYVCVLCACPGTVSQSVTAPDTLDRIQRTKVLNVGYVLYPPAIMKDPASGDLKGHFVDAIKELGRIMNVRVEFTEATWGTFAASLQSGQVDVSIAPTFRTIPRAMAVAFTRPLFYVGNSAIVGAGDERFATLSDVGRPGIRIAVTQGEAGHEYAQANLPDAQLTVLSSADQSLAFTEVSVGRADIALGDAWAVAQYADAHSEVRDVFADHPYNLTSVGWAVRPDEARLLDFLNTSLDFFEDTGKLEGWERNYDAPWYHKRVEWVRSAGATARTGE